MQVTNLILKAAIIAPLLFAFGCKSEKTSDEVDTTTNNSTTQAILKVQPFDYDNLKKDSVSGDYQNRTTLEVPLDLSGQNKWIMFEGPVLENDVVAYRYYADARQRFDIYGKRVNDLVMDTVSWNYHDIMDWGSDILKVGNSLGIASPAIFYEDSVMTLSDYKVKTISVVDNAEMASLLTSFKDLKIGRHLLDIDMTWSLRPNTKWSDVKLEIVKGTLPEGAYFATGLVKHLEEADFQVLGQYNVLSTYGVQSYHEQDLGMAVAAPIDQEGAYVNHKLDHLIVFKKGGKAVSYQFAADWSEGIKGSRSSTEFINNLKASLAD